MILGWTLSHVNNVGMNNDSCEHCWEYNLAKIWNVKLNVWLVNEYFHFVHGPTKIQLTYSKIMEPTHMVEQYYIKFNVYAFYFFAKYQWPGPGQRQRAGWPEQEDIYWEIWDPGGWVSYEHIFIIDSSWELWIFGWNLRWPFCLVGCCFFVVASDNPPFFWRLWTIIINTHLYNVS